MLSLPSVSWMTFPQLPSLVRIERRRRPERRIVGRIAAAARYGDAALFDAALGEALAWPEDTHAEQRRKAELLFSITGLLAGSGHTELALTTAPNIPFAPGMAQVLVFSTGEPQQRFCWRVSAAYALAQGRKSVALPVEQLVQPYRRGEVTIDHDYIQRVLLPRRLRPPPILLLPHPLGQVRLDGARYVILDGNHRVVCAWRQRRFWLPALILAPPEGAAVLISHSRWPPYAPVRTVTSTEAGEQRSKEDEEREER